MTASQPPPAADLPGGRAAASLLERLPALLEFRAPYLERKMLRERMVSSTDEAAALLQEVKKYLVLCRVHRPRGVPMVSRRVDEAWHQFALFTAQYADFSSRFFGEFMHHMPSEAPSQAGAAPSLSLDEFREAYRALFGDLPDRWSDRLALTPSTRLVRAAFRRPLFARLREGRAELVLAREPPSTLARADARALPALAFIAAHDAFYPRELPSLEGDDDRLALCAPLLDQEWLRVAP